MTPSRRSGTATPSGDEASWKSHIKGQLLEGYIAVVYDEKGPSGYLFYTMDDRKLIATEMAFARETGRRGLYAFMAGHRGSIDRCLWQEPLDDRSFRYWNDGAEHTYIKNRTFPYMMARGHGPGHRLRRSPLSGGTGRGRAGIPAGGLLPARQ